jgi:hypothetical protein
VGDDGGGHAAVTGDNDTSNYAWTGAQDAGSTGNEHNTRQFQIDVTQAQQRTKTPVTVVRAPYDADGNDIPAGTAGAIGFIDVHPLVNQVDGNGNATPHGIVYRVPYHRYQSGSGAFISDPVKGDIGDFIIDDRDPSTVNNTSAQGNPGSGLKSSLSNGTYHGQTRAGAPNQHFAWLEEGFDMKDAFGNTLVGTSAGVLINGALITPTGDVISKPNKISLDQHQQSLVMTGTDESGPPVPNT